MSILIMTLLDSGILAVSVAIMARLVVTLLAIGRAMSSVLTPVLLREKVVS